MSKARKPSRQTGIVLRTLADTSRAWRYGYDLSAQTGLKSGTLYPILARLHDRGFLEAEWRDPTEPGRPPRHAYRLTAAGMALAEDLAAPRSGRPPLGVTA